MAFSAYATLVLALASTALAQDNSTTCQSYGVDYQDGGSYFQNTNMNNTFTALQQFSGCTSDYSHNVIVDPNGDQSECSTTPMQPDNTPQLVTCGNWTNQNMHDGDWSLLVISNNNNGTPIAYQRDFQISVGTPTATTTVVPTTTSTVYVTPTDQTSTTTVYDTTYLYTNTRTTASAAGTTTGTDGTVSVTQVATFTETYAVESHCKPTAGPHRRDPLARIVPTILGAELESLVKDIIAALAPKATPTPNSAKFKRAIIEGKKPAIAVKRAFVRERAAYLHGSEHKAAKRSADGVTSTIYNGDFTVTEYSTTTVAPSYTATVTTTSVQTGLVARQEAAPTQTCP